MAEQTQPLDRSQPAPVKCAKEKQAGFDILVGLCPRCGRHISVNGPGQLLCSCGQLLSFAE